MSKQFCNSLSQLSFIIPKPPPQYCQYLVNRSSGCLALCGWVLGHIKRVYDALITSLELQTILELPLPAFPHHPQTSSSILSISCEPLKWLSSIFHVSFRTYQMNILHPNNIPRVPNNFVIPVPGCPSSSPNLPLNLPNSL